MDQVTVEGQSLLSWVIHRPINKRKGQEDTAVCLVTGPFEIEFLYYTIHLFKIYNSMVFFSFFFFWWRY